LVATRDLGISEYRLKLGGEAEAGTGISPLSKFTELVMEYLKVLPEDAKLFEFKRRRAWQIVSHVTGKWCHYFRSHAKAGTGGSMMSSASRNLSKSPQ